MPDTFTRDRIVLQKLTLYKVAEDSNIHVDGEYIASTQEGREGITRAVIDAPLGAQMQATVNAIWDAAETRAKQREGVP